MDTIKHKHIDSQSKKKLNADAPRRGKYSSAEAASAAKMESAKEFIANVDMTLFKQNGHVE